MRFYLITLFLFLSVSLTGQTKDTIQVTDDNTSFLIFPEPILIISLGVPDDYFYRIEGTTVFLKAKKKFASVSTILVKYGETYFYSLLKFEPFPKKFMYNYSGNVITEEEKKQAEKKDSVKEVKQKEIVHDNIAKIGDNPTNIDEQKLEKVNKYDLSVIQARLNKLASQGKLKTLGVFNNKIYISLSNISNDQTHFYFKFLVYNKSSLDYKIDVVNFQYVEANKKGFLKKKTYKENDLFPTIKPDKIVLKGKATEALGYAIPIFALNEKGWLKITFREYSGNRIMTLEVPSDILSDSDKIE